MARKTPMTKSKNRKKVNMMKLSKQLRREDLQKRTDSKRKHEREKQAAKAKRRKQLSRAFFPYASHQHILLVGEGNCSFARAIVRKYRETVSGILNKFGYPIPSDREINKGCAIDFQLLELICKDRLISQREAQGNYEPLDIDEEEEDSESEEDEEDDDEEEEEEADADMNDEDDEDDEDYDAKFMKNLDDMEEEVDEDVEFDEDMEEFDEDDDMNDEDEEMTPYDIDLANGIEHNNGLLKYTYQTCAQNLLVTCYDSLEIAVEKYPDLREIVREIQSAGGRVVFGVDSTTMSTLLFEHELVPENKFDCIAFNFPHVGSGEQDIQANIQENQQLILGYLTQSLALIRKPYVKSRKGSRANLHEYEDTPNEQLNKTNSVKHHVPEHNSQAFNENFTMSRGGIITLTVKTGEPYDSWRIPTIARIVNHNQLQAQQYKEDMAGVQRGGWNKKFPKIQLLRKLVFFPEVYPGYTHRRTIGFKHGISRDDNTEITKTEPKTYIFCRAPDDFVDRSVGLAFNQMGEDMQSQITRKKELRGKMNKPTTIKQVLKARTATKSGRKRRNKAK